MLRRATYLALALAITGCELPSEDLGSHRSEIVGGMYATDDPAVVEVSTTTADETILCSGTLISPRVVLTAAHCVDVGDPRIEQTVYFGSRKIADPAFLEELPVVDHYFMPDWSLGRFGEGPAGDDLALLVLARKAAIAPMPFNVAPLDDRDIGRRFRLVGWGTTTMGSDDGGAKRTVTTTLNGFVNDDVLTYGRLWATTCTGDSGGPGLMEIDGREVVVSITSFGVDCERNTGGTRVASYADVIDDFLADNDPDWNCEDTDSCYESGCSASNHRNSGGAVLALLFAVAFLGRRRR